jgi:hypothetical protein
MRSKPATASLQFERIGWIDTASIKPVSKDYHETSAAAVSR